MHAKQLVIFIMTACLLCGSLYAQVFPGRKGFDRYGGYLTIKGTATGRFHLEVIDSRHFLVTPEGHGFVSIGVTHIGAVGRLDQSKYDYLIEKCGGNWDKVNADLSANFRKWGFNSLGYDSHWSTRKLLPYFAGCQPTKVSVWLGDQIVFPDVFSSAWKQEARRTLEQVVKNYGVTPNLIGIYWTDVPAWDLKQQRRIAGQTWVDAIRALPDDAPGRIRYERFLRENGLDASDEDFLVLMARELYSHVGPLTRELAPNTLVFGERYAGWAMPWRIIQEALPWIDVVSVQPYASEFPVETFERLYRETGKPVMICDHNISVATPEYPNIMWETLPDAASAGKAYGRYLEKAFSMPFLIGYNRCQYIDRYQGRQKILKQGLLQVDGTPYEELVDWVQKANWRIHERFLRRGGKHVP